MLFDVYKQCKMKSLFKHTVVAAFQGIHVSLVMGDRLKFIIDHRLESVDAFDAILPITIGSHIFTK